MITTHNRPEELERTLQHLKNLQPVLLEMLITTDGCGDDTVSVIDRIWPSAFVFRNKNCLGSVASRAKMMQHTQADVVFSLDDDSYPAHSDTLSALGYLFHKNDRLAIVTFPQITDEYPNSPGESNFGLCRQVRSFPNSGACLRVSAYRELSGFEPMFFHMYEEPDYALQCIANGWEVQLIPDIIIRHHWTPNQRSELRNHHLHARNEFWSTIMRCPFPQLPLLLLWRIGSQARYAFSRGFRWFFQEPQWWWQAILGIPQAWRRRSPLPWSGYRKWLSLPDP